MRRTSFSFAFLIVLSIPTIALADEPAMATPKGISSPLGESVGDPCNGVSHLEEVQCLGKALQVQDQEINRAYKRALEALPKQDGFDIRKTQSQLVKSQRAWLKYRDENCTLVGGLEGGSNLWVTHFAAPCAQKETAERIKFLESIADGNDLH